MARKAGQGEEEEESRARQQGGESQSAMKRRCRSYRSDMKLRHDISAIWLPKQDLDNDNINGHATVEGGNLMSSNLRQRTTGKD
ncbi:hypothetical protein STEG23_024902 [Scotinomys teguina]